MKIKGIKKAVGNYNRSNAGGYYSPVYGYLMMDRETGEVWTDIYNSIGHNSWTEYNKPSIINLVTWAYDHGMTESGKVNMETVKTWAEEACKAWPENA